MKRIHCLVLSVGVVALAAAQPAFGLRVVTTTPDLAAITRAVGGSQVTVSSIALGVQDLHKIEAKPSFIRDVSKADLVIFNGLELEIGWLPLLIEGARNPKVRPGSKGSLDASTDVKVIEKPTGALDRSQGDVHPDGNPHYLLDPRNGVIVARTIAQKLSELDGANRAEYERGLAEFTRDMNARIARWETRLAVVQDMPVVAYHKTWEYLSAWAKFRIIDYVEEKPGIPGSPRHIASVIKRIGDEDALAVIGAIYDPRKERETIARRTSIADVTLPSSVGAEKGVDTYPALFEAIVSRLTQVSEGARR